MSYSNEIRVVIIITLIFVFTEGKVSVNPPKTQSNEQKLKEISKLRSDLNTALEKNADGNGAVVQPGWTQQAGGLRAADAKVEITQQGLAEAKALRDQIHKAVAKDEYVAGVAQTSAGDTMHVKDLEKQFSLKGQGKEALESLSMPPTNRSEEKVGAQMGAGSSDSAEPNIVEANSSLEPDIDMRKLQTLEVSKRRTKEVLKLKLVEEDFGFTLGDDVQEWEHIVHNGSEYFIGRREIDLLIVHKESSKYEPGAVLSIGLPITYLETYSYWNSQQQQQEGVILVAAENKVLWYRANPASGQIELYWEWLVGSTVSGLTYFTVDTRDYLVVSSNQSLRAGYYALNIYQYDLVNKEFWIAQRMQLEHPCGRVTVLNTGRDILLGIVQNNTAAIYSYNPHVEGSGHLRFQAKQSIESEGIESMSAFQMGGRSYLALGGLKPQILLYQQGELVPKTILGHNFGLVDLFFPIPARTYRDDLLLLVQHRVDFGTHVLTVLETLIWDGESFETSIPVPCQLGNHFTYGVSCMLDIQRDDGLKGATLLRRGDEISVIVPRHKAESGLFRLHIELLQKNSELLDLQEIFEFLKEWVKEQDDLVTQAHAFLAANDDEIAGKVPDIDAMEMLETPELTFGGEVQQIHINDYKWTDQDTNTDLFTVIDAIEQLEKDLRQHGQRQRRDLPTEQMYIESMEVNNLDVYHLTLEAHNDVRFYVQDGSLNFEGILNLDSLQVTEELITREPRQVSSTEPLEIDGDLEFEEINGVKWTDIEENLIFRTDALNLTMMDVEGEVVMEDVLEVKVLNNLNFPDDYLWSSGPATSAIIGQKIFTNTLSANAVDNDGLINGLNPFDAITLSEPQDWKGLPTFAHLEVSEKFELNGTAKGEGLENYRSNPSLAEAQQILAACNFEQLQVVGPLKVTGLFVSPEMEDVLTNIVQLPANRSIEIPVSGSKTFSSVLFPLDFHVGDNKINDIQVDDFVTVNTEQKLRIPVLNGYVYFHNLTVKGRYDGVDINDLVKRAIRTDAPQVATDIQLNFIDMLNANELHVLKTLNRLPIPDAFQSLDSDLSIPRVKFENVIAKVANIPKGIQGKALLNGVDLNEFLEDRAWNGPHDTGNIYLQELHLEQSLDVDKIYNIDMKYLMQFLDSVDDLPEMILEGKIQVDHVVVQGNVQANRVNGKHFEKDVKDKVIWLNKPNYLTKTLSFKGAVKICGNLTVLGEYNGVNLPDLIDDMVFHNGVDVITAPKNFLGNIYVLGDSSVAAINGVNMQDIATTRNVNNFKGSLHINGNLFVEDLTIKGKLNGFPMAELNQLIRYDSELNAFVVLGVTEFPKSWAFKDLTVLGDFNGTPKLREFFEDLVYLDGPIYMQGRKNFTGRITIEQGAYIHELNDLNLEDLFNNIVYTNQPQLQKIESPVVFKGSVNVYEAVVEDYLKTDAISGCSVSQWLDDTIRVDRDENLRDKLHFAPNSLNENNLLSSTLNGINLDEVITLNRPQNLSGNIEFAEIFLNGEILTNGLVNDVDLPMEYENTFMTHGNQHITTPLTIQSIQVLGDLHTNAPVNGDKNLHNVASIDGEPLRFESPLYFQNVNARNLQTNDLVSGINLMEWYDKALWLKERPRQVITGNWTVRNLRVKNGPASKPTYMLNGWDYNGYMRSSESDNDEEEEGFAALCKQVKKLLKAQQNRPYLVKHLEKTFEVELNESNSQIRKAFVLQNATENYLLVNTDCSSVVYQWHSHKKTFEKKSSFESGPIDQVALLPHEHGTSKDSLQFVTSYESVEPLNCSMIGLNAWQVIGSDKKVTHLRSFEEMGSDQLLSAGNKLYGSNGSVIHEVSVCNETHIVEFIENKDYHFLPRSQDGENANHLALTNGEHILVHNKPGSRKINRLYESRVGAAKLLPEPTISVLKPDEMEARKLTYADFKQVIESILSDLIDRLNQEVNITQLSIPESDLYDEHLVQDFIGIMEELHKQQIFPADTFADINWAAMKIPGNPAQVLAARTVQIVWPVIVEIEEVHDYLKENATHEHPVCACIMSSLGMLVRDVLMMANKDQAKDENVAEQIESVIGRIREFQNDLKEMTKKLKGEIKEELSFKENDPVLTSAPTQSNQSEDSSEFSSNSSTDATDLTSNSSWLILQRSHLPARGQGEMLSLSVGPRSQQRYLLAVISYHDHAVGVLNDNVKLYTDRGLEGNSFQVLPAHKPHLLRSLRIRDEVFLIFVEHCCTVRVLIYRGVQGFVQFTRFKMNEKIKDLIVLKLPNEGDNVGVEKFYLATVLQEKLVFYEFVVYGVKDLSQIALKCT